MNTFEDWAKQVVAKELGEIVDVHDDGSESGMYDLRIGEKNAPEYAIECVGAVNFTATETWNIGPAKGPIRINSAGDWIVSIKDSAKIKSLKRSISSAIGKCEELGLTEYTPVNWELRNFNEDIFNVLNGLGVSSFYMYRAKGSSKVHLTMDGKSGAVNQNADDLVGWVDSFLSSDDKADVVKKLRNSNAKEKHAFIPIILGGAPWYVESIFFSDMQAPNTPPKLPKPITGVWITSNGRGLRYMEGQWHLFTC